MTSPGTSSSGIKVSVVVPVYNAGAFLERCAPGPARPVHRRGRLRGDLRRRRLDRRLPRRRTGWPPYIRRCGCTPGELGLARPPAATWDRDGSRRGRPVRRPGRPAGPRGARAAARPRGAERRGHRHRPAGGDMSGPGASTGERRGSLAGGERGHRVPHRAQDVPPGLPGPARHPVPGGLLADGGPALRPAGLRAAAGIRSSRDYVCYFWDRRDDGENHSRAAYDSRATTSGCATFDTVRDGVEPGSSRTSWCGGSSAPR